MQSGDGGAAMLNVGVIQNGADNLSDILQDGSGHTATVTQNSDANESFVNQSGSGNSVTVMQGS